MADTQSKRCRKCNEVKPLEDFHRRAASPDGRQPYCRPCNSKAAAAGKIARKSVNPEYREHLRAYRAEHYRAHREAQKACSRAWRSDNPDKVKAARTAYVANNPDKIRETQRKYREGNREKRHEGFRDWARRNPESVRIRLHRRRARLADVLSIPYTKEQVAQRFAIYGNKCWMCGGESSTIDHVKPISRGGPDILANLRPACSRDNSAKRDRWYGVAGLNRFIR